MKQDLTYILNERIIKHLINFPQTFWRIAIKIQLKKITYNDKQNYGDQTMNQQSSANWTLFICHNFFDHNPRFKTNFVFVQNHFYLFDTSTESVYIEASSQIRLTFSPFFVCCCHSIVLHTSLPRKKGLLQNMCCNIKLLFTFKISIGEY